MVSRRWAPPSLLLVVGALSACASTHAHRKSPVEVATSFVRDYEKWAQNGCSSPMPPALPEASSSEMLEVLVRDQKWYSSGGVRQHGAVRILQAEESGGGDGQVVVTITLDASDVTVTADGRATWVDYSRPIITRFSLTRRGIWRITSTKTDQ